MAVGFARINGLPFRIESGSPEQSALVIGELMTSRDGYAQDTRRDERERHTMTLACSTQAAAEEIAEIIEGRAHVFAFTVGLEAAGGAGPAAASIVQLRPLEGFFGGAAFVPDSEDPSWPLQLGDRWTVIARSRVADASSPWQMIALRSDGAGFVDGVAAAGVGDVILVTAGSLSLLGDEVGGGGGGADRLFDEVIAFPRELLDETIVALHALDEPYAPMPALHVRGDAVAEPLGLIMRGDVVDAPYLQAGAVPGASAGWRNNAMRVDFRLRQIAARLERASVPLPVAYWDFDALHTEGGAPEVVDVVSGHDGTLQGATTSGVEPGKPVDGEATGEALSVPSGAGQGVTVPDAAALRVVGDLTIAAWVKLDAYPSNSVIMQKHLAAASGDPYRFMVGTAGELLFSHESAGGTTETFTSAVGVVPLDTWVWVAVTRRAGAHVEFWINGGRDIRGRSASVETPGSNTAVVAVAHDDVGTLDFDGHLDDLAIWNVELTSAQILGAYLAVARGETARYRATG